MTPEAALIESTMKIVNKRGEVVPFILNDAQRRYDELRTHRDIILKARQEGFSSFIDALFTLECLAKRNLRCILIAHDRTSTEKMFDRVRFFIENLKDGAKPDLSRASRREFYFRKTNSVFYIGTAGYEEFGRGDTINRLHCSEIASWNDPATVASGLFRAVPIDGHIILESTAKGQGNWFHARCTRAIEQRGRYTLHFFPWFEDPGYAEDTTLTYEDLDESERELYTTILKFHTNGACAPEGRVISHDQTPEGRLIPNTSTMDTTDAQLREKILRQLQWRRNEIEDMDESETVHGSNLFPQEYPATPDEAFIAAGMSVFRAFSRPSAPVLHQDRFLTVWKHPVKAHRYGIGADVSAGVGSDRSIAHIIDFDTFECVAEWCADCVDPDEFAEYLADLGNKYNMAHIIPELNNHGHATVAQLRRVYPTHKIMQRYSYEKREQVQRLSQLGWLTTEKSKSLMITNLRKALRGGYRIYGTACRNELTTYVEHDGGRLGAQQGCFDDRVIAAALAITGYRELAKPHERPTPPEPSPMTFQMQRKRAIAEFVGTYGVTPSEYYSRTTEDFIN